AVAISSGSDATTNRGADAACRTAFSGSSTARSLGFSLVRLTVDREPVFDPCSSCFDWRFSGAGASGRDRRDRTAGAGFNGAVFTGALADFPGDLLLFALCFSAEPPRAGLAGVRLTRFRVVAPLRLPFLMASILPLIPRAGAAKQKISVILAEIEEHLRLG